LLHIWVLIVNDNAENIPDKTTIVGMKNKECMRRFKKIADYN